MSAAWHMAVLCLAATAIPTTARTDVRADIGRPAGLIPDCPGVLKNSSVSPQHMDIIRVIYHRVTNKGVSRRSMPIESAAKMIAKDKTIDFKNKKTVLYSTGYFDSVLNPVTAASGTIYFKRGYNVFLMEPTPFLMEIYPISARIIQFIGLKFGEFLVELTQQGLEAENLELIGVSLGAHAISHSAKYFYKTTGKKPHRLTGLDPAGPCFRNLDPEYRLWRTDATHVDVVHTNIDGFGIAEPLGHVDFYVNGGEFQPGDIPAIPCLILCSHIRSIIYWWIALEHPKKFVAIQCDSVQDARNTDCQNNTVINYMGLETKFDRPGIYYLPTNNEYPYYLGRNGTQPGDNIYVKITKMINAVNNLVL